jgi:large subunit ribosomal protein L21e
MPSSFGYRARTRQLFRKGFREHGPIKLSTYMTTYKVGDLVDIAANSAQQRGMPHKFYHGRTGVVFNVTPRALGIIVHKRVGNKMMEKRVNIRVEHVKLSKCRDDFLRRVKENEERRREAKETGVKVSLKRQPGQPRTAHFVSSRNNKPVLIAPVPYEDLI